MPSLRTWCTAAIVTAFAVSTAALHEDEAGQFDWHAPGIGVPTRAVFGPQSKELKALYTITASNVVASLRVKTGEVRWRRVLGEKDQLACVAVSGAAVVAATQAGDVFFFDAVHGTPLRTGTASLAPKAVLDCAATEAGAVRFVVADRTADGFSAPAVVVMTDGRNGVASPIAVEAAVSAARVAANGQIDLTTAAGVVTVDAETGKASKAAAAAPSPLTLSATGAVELNGVALDVKDRAAAVPAVLAVRTSGKRTDSLFVSHLGHLHFAAVADGAVSTAWSAPFGVAEPAQVVFASHPVFEEGSHERETQFGMRQVFVVVSKRGGLYGYATKGHGTLAWSASAVLKAEEQFPDVKGAPCTVDAAFADGHSTVVRLRFGKTLLQLAYDAATGAFISARGHHDDAVLSLPDGTTVREGLKTDATAPQDRHFYTVDRSEGRVAGFTIPGNETQARGEWSLNHGGALAMVADGSNPFAIATVEGIRMVPGGKDDAKEVRKKFPLANVLVTAHYAAVQDDDADEADATTNALVLTAVNTATGSVLATMNHVGATGAVHGVLADNALVYHYFDSRAGKHRVGVWEFYAFQEIPMLDSQTTSPAQIVMSFLNKRATFRTRRARAPTVNTRVLSFAHGAVDALGVTATAQGIARKQVIFATTKGVTYAVPLTTLLAGGMPADSKAPVDSVLALPTHAVSHRNRVLSADVVASAPTPLESTAHVVVAGLDLFYTRASSGKPFDMLNEDFNKPALLAVCGVLPIAALVLRAMSNRKALKAAWA